LYKSLAENLELVQLTISEAGSERKWEGNLLGRRRFVTLDEKRHKRRYFNLPLLEDLWSGETNGRCEICRRPDRAAIDEEIRRGVRFNDIARRRSIPYGTRNSAARRFAKHLCWHAGRLSVRSRRLAGHVGHASAANLVAIPTGFLNQVAHENAPNLGHAIFRLLGTTPGSSAN
jgi:hypothetical protein